MTATDRRLVDRTELARRAPVVAPALLNTLLVADVEGARVVGRIVETEAYDEDDPASHTFRGPTPRNAPMFGSAGHVYVYLSYGIHHCANVVCGPERRGEAVLLRAVEVIEGIDTVRRRRSGRPDRELTDGPGKLCQALGIDLSHDSIDALAPASPIRLARDRVAPPGAPLVGPRIGISAGVDTPWRFRVP